MAGEATLAVPMVVLEAVEAKEAAAEVEVEEGRWGPRVLVAPAQRFQ